MKAEAFRLWSNQGSSMTKFGNVMRVCAAIAALQGVTAAWAAPADQPSTTTDTASANSDDAIVVTGSRIDRAGFQAPTPTVHLPAADLAIGARANVAAALNDLPQFRATTSAQTTGTNTGAGQAPVDLRGLGVSHTLVLLDGHRLVSDNDLNTIPTVLMKTVDVVTGGASAAWGSGAVAGVVNIVLDDKYKGLELGVEKGISSYNDDASTRFSGKFGADFAGGRGHVLVGGEYYDSEGVVPKASRPNVGRWATISNGDGTFSNVPNVGFANAARGGLILSGVNKGQVFGSDGTLHTFDVTKTVGTNAIGNEAPSNDDLSPLVTPQRRYSALGRVSYEFSDAFKLTGEVRHSRMWNNYIWFGDHNRGNLTIGIDNAFLPAAQRQAMLAAGQTSFTMGRFNDDLSYSTIDFQRVVTQGTLSADGRFNIGDKDFRWSAYYSYGAFDTDIRTPGFLLKQNYANAVDSIISPTTGQAVCRSGAAGCVPINLFGEGSPSQAAIDYVTGTPESHSHQTLNIGGVSLRGEPFSTWAGPVSFAVGGEVRREQINTKVGALDAAGAFSTFSFAPLHGGFTVKEGFGEIVVPLAKDLPVLRDLELNAAGRISDYSTTGSIWSWKVGLTDEVFQGFRLRGTRSRDIRAANLTELYTQSSIGYNTLTDPQTNQSVYVQNIGGGNRNLKPETADTWTGGFTYSPAIIPGLDLSVDYYNIKIKDIITSIAAQDLVTRCYNGNASLCSQISRDASGTITQTRSGYVNLSQYKTDGIDAELSYRMPLSRIAPTLPGMLRFHLTGTWMNRLAVDDGISTIDYVRSQGYSFGLGVPKWRANGSIGYEGARVGGEIRARYISPGLYNSTVNLTNNHINAYTYFDLEAHTRIPSSFGGTLELYVNVSNLLDKDPPVSSLYSPYYDVVGRFISVGARVKF
jgi:outer membrane receptor protein involved in Fe transport